MQEAKRRINLSLKHSSITYNSVYIYQVISNEALEVLRGRSYGHEFLPSKLKCQVCGERIHGPGGKVTTFG
jgi:hypothetical protein